MASAGFDDSVLQNLGTPEFDEGWRKGFILQFLSLNLRGACGGVFEGTATLKRVVPCHSQYSGGEVGNGRGVPGDGGDGFCDAGEG
jgi:hypothetical protein